MDQKWILKDSGNINRMLKVRDELKDFNGKEQYPLLLTITHKYATSDDVLFPEPVTLAFFAGFEQNCLEPLQEQGSIKFVASDINTGLLKLYIYTKDAQQTIFDTIEYLKQKPEFKVEFHINQDNKWDFYNSLL